MVEEKISLRDFEMFVQRIVEFLDGFSDIVYDSDEQESREWDDNSLSVLQKERIIGDILENIELLRTKLELSDFRIGLAYSDLLREMRTEKDLALEDTPPELNEFSP